MQKKLKQRKIIIFAISVLIAFMIASMLSGKESKQPLVIVVEELDVTKTLGEQVEKFTVIPVSQNESSKLGDSVVRSLGELKDARIAIPLPPGSPIPKALIATKKTGGDFTLETPEFRTWYRFVGGIGMLPPGVAEGDSIDISFLYLDENGSGNNILTLFLAEKEIAMVNEVDIWIKVSQEEFEMLTVGSKIGQYILQLPGKKSASKCEDLPINERTESDCYFENYKPGKITTDDIKKMIKEGKMNTQINKTYEESKNNEENDSKKEVNDQGNPKDVIEKQQSVDDDKKNSDTGKEKPGTNEQELSPKEQKEERKKKDALIQDFFKD